MQIMLMMVAMVVILMMVTRWQWYASVRFDCQNPACCLVRGAMH
jgi:hypothetical protein